VPGLKARSDVTKPPPPTSPPARTQPKVGCGAGFPPEVREGGLRTVRQGFEPLVGLAVAALLLFGGCRQQTEPPSLPAPPSPTPVAAPVAMDPWEPVGTDPASPYHPYLGNGYVGFRVGPTGCGWNAGTPLPAYVAGLYVTERLATIPCPGVIEIRAGNDVLGARSSALSGYSQRLSFRDGTLTTQATWRAGGAGAEATITCAPLRARPHLVMTQVQLRNSGSMPITVAAPPPRF